MVTANCPVTEQANVDRIATDDAYEANFQCLACPGAFHAHKFPMIVRGGFQVTSSQTECVELGEAIKFLKNFEQRFFHQPHIYQQFLRILWMHQKGRTPREQLHGEVSQLFGEGDLLECFKRFMPQSPAAMMESQASSPHPYRSRGAVNASSSAIANYTNAADLLDNDIENSATILKSSPLLAPPGIKATMTDLQKTGLIIFAISSIVFLVTAIFAPNSLDQKYWTGTSFAMTVGSLCHVLFSDSTIFDMDSEGRYKSRKGAILAFLSIIVGPLLLGWSMTRALSIE